MTMNLFDQFMSPQMLGIPLIIIAMLLPTMLIYTNTRLMPNRTTTALTNSTLMITKQLMSPLNKPGQYWAMPLITLLYYLLTLNLLGLLPYTFTPTTQLSMNMALATPLWFTTILTGLRTQPTTALAHLLPTGTPTPLIPVLILIETASLLIRPVALGVRLTANLTAGHLLIMLISTTTLYMLPTMPLAAVLTGTLLFLLTLLEIAVAMIQAYVFILLMSLYMQENT